MPSPSSRFVWHEMRTTDAEASQAFYCAVIGWQAQHWDVDGKRYTRLTLGGVPVAGLMTLPAEALANGAQTRWVGYVGVDDADAVAAHIQQAGGTMYHPPIDIPEIGRFTTVADPQKAVFALFQPLPGMTGEPLPPGTPGTPGWNELHAEDWTTAFPLYTELFGWQKGDAIDMGPMGTYQLFTTGDVPIGGMMTRMDPASRPGWLYYFNVAGIEAAAARVTAAGGQVLNGPHQVPGGSWIIQGMDPVGGMFGLVSPPQ